MNIKNSKQIITEFIDRYNFAHIFVDKGLPFGKNLSPLPMDNEEGARFLLSSALTGCKTIGFFTKIPKVDVKYPVRGECLLIGFELSDRVDIPTVFCRNLEETLEALSIAMKVSSESKLPVGIIINDKVYGDFVNDNKSASDLVRTSPYLHPNTLKNVFNKESFSESVSVADSIFKTLKSTESIDNSISFHDTDYPFFRYLLPDIAPELKSNKLSAPKGEAQYIENFLNNSYALDVIIDELGEKEPLGFKDFLCPGCPFVNTIARLANKDVILFTDINCEGILKTYPLNVTDIESYMGLLSDNLNVKTLFIGAASSYKPCYNNLLRNGNLIFLNDCGIKNIDICVPIKHPKKLTGTRNSLFAYSCNNIKSYSNVKVNIKRCKCNQEGKPFACIEATKCPAIYIKGDKACIDIGLCTGCLGCKISCPFGAVS